MNIDQLHPEVRYLKTREAAAYLGCSPNTLKNSRDIAGGFLVMGKQWIPPVTKTGSIRWDIGSVAEAFRYRGMQRMRAEAIIASLQAEEQKDLIERGA